eukprot:scaffold19959_cov20-Tisochrysis_lutea.AAC.1
MLGGIGLSACMVVDVSVGDDSSLMSASDSDKAGWAERCEQRRQWSSASGGKTGIVMHEGGAVSGILAATLLRMDEQIKRSNSHKVANGQTNRAQGPLGDSAGSSWRLAVLRRLTPSGSANKWPEDRCVCQQGHHQ